MTQQEFKAWFDGFIEGMVDEVPTPDQWAKIKETVAEIWIPMTVTQTVSPNVIGPSPFLTYTDELRASDASAWVTFGR